MNTVFWYNLGYEGVDCPLQVGNELAPQMEEFEYFGICS